MYEAKYQKYIMHNTTRFAEAEEIKKCCLSVDNGSAAGIPLYYDFKNLYVDNEDNHSIIIGPTGCKKSRITVFSTVASIIKAGESAIINDPKGEIYRNTAGIAKEKDFNVFVLNFRKPSESHFWNPLRQARNFFDKGMDDEGYQCLADFAELVIEPAIKNDKDKYWESSTKSFLIALLLVLNDSVSEDYFNLTNLLSFSYEENQGTLKGMLADMDQTSVAAYGMHTVLDLKAENTKSCIYGTLQAVISSFVNNKGLLRMLSDSSFDIESIGKKQTIIYIIYPDEKKSLNFLVNLFLTQCYETLVAIAASEENDRLPIRVNFVLDEFSNLTPVSNFDNRISEARSKNIRYFLVVQSYGQLKDKYNECAETILSNCNNWICFSSKETDFLDKLSRICGKEIDYNGIEHDLLPASSMQYFHKGKEGAEVLIIKQGQFPFVTELPDYEYTSLFKNYVKKEVPIIKSISNAKFVSFTEWIAKVNNDEFKFPYPKNS